MVPCGTYLKSTSWSLAAVQKKGKERKRSWLANGPWLVLLLIVTTSLYWYASREPSGLSLKYGEFTQILQDPGVSFQNVKTEPADIRGEIITRSPITDGEKNGTYQSKPKPFHTSRRGLENDQTVIER